MPRRSFLFLATSLALVSSACDRAAMDPTIADDPALRLHRAAPGNTLPSLFHEALQTMQQRAGTREMNVLADTWQARQAEVQAAYSARDLLAVQARLSALRAEETRVILKVLGPSVIARVLAESNEALVSARSRILAASQKGVDTQAAESAVATVNEMLSRATALAAQDPARALMIATDAATQLGAINDLTVGLARLRGVDELFPALVEKMPAEQLRHHARLNTEARQALRNGRRDVANQKLAAVRAEEIRMVLLATSGRAAGELVTQVGSAIPELRSSLETFRAQGREVGRAQRMLASATDLYNRSRHAQSAGDHVTALDLSSHAAGLLNSLRHLLSN